VKKGGIQSGQTPVCSGQVWSNQCSRSEGADKINKEIQADPKMVPDTFSAHLSGTDLSKYGPEQILATIVKMVYANSVAQLDMHRP